MQRLALVSPRNIGFSSRVSARALIGATPALPSDRLQRGTKPHCMGNAVLSPAASSTITGRSWVGAALYVVHSGKRSAGIWRSWKRSESSVVPSITYRPHMGTCSFPTLVLLKYSTNVLFLAALAGENSLSRGCGTESI